MRRVNGDGFLGVYDARIFMGYMLKESVYEENNDLDPRSRVPAQQSRGRPFHANIHSSKRLAMQYKLRKIMPNLPTAVRTVVPHEYDLRHRRLAIPRPLLDRQSQRRSPRVPRPECSQLRPRHPLR